MKPKTSKIVVRHIREQNYLTFFNPATGFFARIEQMGHDEPFWSWRGPELLDVALTSWCDRECPTCYRGSNTSGKHMSLSDFEKLMRQACQMGVLQVAFGGGNPNQHPDFCEILRLTRQTYDIVPSYTTNGKGLTPAVLSASRDYCGAVAVSAYSPYDEMVAAVRTLVRQGIKTNVHFVLDNRNIDVALGWLESPPVYLDEVNALVFLNYKPIGRGGNSALLLKHSDKLKRFFEMATRPKRNFKIGFDSCLVSGVARSGNVPAVCYDRCEAARFSMFVSEDMRMYPCSFMIADYEGVPMTEDNMLDVWRSSDLFVQMRCKLRAKRCPACEAAETCHGGCPAFEEINVCCDQRVSLAEEARSASAQQAGW